MLHGITFRSPYIQFVFSTLCLFHCNKRDFSSDWNHPFGGEEEVANIFLDSAQWVQSFKAPAARGWTPGMIYRDLKTSLRWDCGPCQAGPLKPQETMHSTEPLHIYTLKSNMSCLLWQNVPQPWKATVANIALIWNQKLEHKEKQGISLSALLGKDSYAGVYCIHGIWEAGFGVNSFVFSVI